MLRVMLPVGVYYSLCVPETHMCAPYTYSVNPHLKSDILTQRGQACLIVFWSWVLIL